ncbi:tRNA (adenosine(37)-N6)-threonylcarbamoyltransferase complex ATPase subunit type 1 TsaE [Acetobacter sp. AN02]|uniref:tRNA (adenosine(37)-N6)-threonylcarbamoyltransferase complex ATPase subunit type 1 TsaE n=1 Tax=Acetobacter sp. AN02 TaxID=2894186 RepID=UPI0024343351|nr:tRNA (adenosine(37)-N6)-threonylcarbamoyltransferase complex ATPase subunit type 1 TsaE [Acetobacter sp. AN02]MDG6094498.1 tRNA (adenosine(37)-N6)-threonylcarbamoyltransferase complex ATPase subunit type 1 TsaE [Acetobacter sp. AN02]
MTRTEYLADRAATRALACRLALLARPGDVILLEGPLGAGKSTFARAFVRARAQDPALDVPSPTFTLVQVYEFPDGDIAHFDLWRLDGEEALEEIGWDEARAGIVLAEWPDRLGSLLPPEALRIILRPVSGVIATGEDGEEDCPREAVLAGWEGRL